MAVLDDIAAQRQRLVERLARVDAERERLTEELAELEAAERVLSRLTPTKAAPRGLGTRARAGAAATATATPSRRRGRRARQKEATAPATAARRRGNGRGRKTRAKPEMPLAEATLRAVEALGNGTSAEQIREYLGREFGIQVRPNHLGMALARHRRAGRLHEGDGRWSTMQEFGEAQPER